MRQLAKREPSRKYKGTSGGETDLDVASFFHSSNQVSTFSSSLLKVPLSFNISSGRLSSITRNLIPLHRTASQLQGSVQIPSINHAQLINNGRKHEAQRSRHGTRTLHGSSREAGQW